MKKFLIMIMAGLLISSSAFGWGREGHETIAKIADNNLKPSARKVIEKYLGDHSIVYYAKWMDEYRRTPEYAFTSSWHVARVDENLKYSPYPETGDAISGINDAVELLRNYKNLPDSTVASSGRRYALSCPCILSWTQSGLQGEVWWRIHQACQGDEDPYRVG